MILNTFSLLNKRTIIHGIIFFIYLTLSLFPGGIIMLSELDRNPQDEFCESIKYENLKYSKNDLGFVYVFPKFVPYAAQVHDKLSTFYYPSRNGNHIGANWIAYGLPCRLQFNTLIISFLPGFLFLSVPLIIIFRNILKKLSNSI